jgi:hypothetical protein
MSLHRSIGLVSDKTPGRLEVEVASKDRASKVELFDARGFASTVESQIAVAD